MNNFNPVSYEPQNGDIVVSLNYGTLIHSLTGGTRASLLKASAIWKAFPSASLAWSANGNCFEGSALRESALRSRMLFIERSVPREKLVQGAVSMNTVTEALSIKQALDEKSIHPRTIIIVCEELHSRSVKFIWSRVFPDARILISCIHYTCGFQPDHPILLQRTLLRRIACNILRYIALRVFGLERVSKIIHPVAKS